MNLPSKTLEDAVEAFASLPGIGRKTALRLALHMLKEDKNQTYRKLKHQMKSYIALLFATAVLAKETTKQLDAKLETEPPVESFEEPVGTTHEIDETEKATEEQEPVGTAEESNLDYFNNLFSKGFCPENITGMENLEYTRL